MKTKCKSVRILAFIMAFLMVCLFNVPSDIIAKDLFTSNYIQTIFNQKNGIGSNEVNCLYQSISGYIWIGTDGGLYRSNGSEFSSINLWDTDRTDVYSINCMIQDKDGRMWIGTDNYGLFYIEDGESFHLQDEYYNGIKTIIDLCETDDGIVYAATTEGLFTCEKDDAGVTRLVEYQDKSISGFKFTDMASVNGDIWAIYGNSNIYVINDTSVQYIIDTSDIVYDELSCIESVNGEIYVGSSGRDIIHYRSRSRYSVLTSSIDGINSLMMDSDGYLWACSDNGLGYFNKGKSFVRTSDCKIDNYLSDMIQDYEGNYWISSSRMGVLLLSRSKFTDYNMYTGMNESMVNTVYTYGSNKYIGTEDGLIIYDSMNVKVVNELTDMLSGISVRHIISDDNGNLWISTFRKYGVVRVSSDGNIDYIGRGSGLPSASVNSTLPLSNGNIAVATEDGVAIINGDNKVVNTYGSNEGMEHRSVTCLYQNDDGRIYAGTDGGGIYVINPGSRDQLVNYNIDSGLNSNAITSIEKGKEGLWIGTDNGLCFYKEAFRSISNVEYSNSIYDIIIQDGFVWIIGSMGILRSTEEELLGSSGIAGGYFNENDGLTKTINTINNSYIDRYGVLYICCNTGICTMDTQNIPYNLVQPKIKVTSIDIDGQLYELDDLADGLRIKSDVSRITIDFAVFSYSNRNNMQVEYSLNGFDEQPIVLNGNEVMEAVYTNLDGGVYKFVISAYNGDGTPCENSVSFIIEKENSLFENHIARVGIVFVIILGFVLLGFGIFRVHKLLKNKNKALEKLSKEHEEAVKSSSAKNDYLANISNEIKIPINAMMVKADELLDIIEEDVSYKESIKGIYNIGSDIINKVDDIILLAKIEAGKLDLINSSYSITTMIYDLSEIAMEKIGDKAVKFFVEIGENITDNVIGDGQKIKAIMVRLLDNSIKSTKDGSITLSVDCYEYMDKQHHDMLNVVFTISDTGIGIQEDKVDTIFEAYSISDNMKNTPHSVSSVGLAIAKGYADILGGEIDVESVYGAGSTFTLTVNQKAAGRLSSGQMITKIGDTVSKEVADKLWLPEVTALLVDDEEVSREVSIKVMAPFEMKLDVESSGVSAIDMVMNNDYDVIFMDLSMPIMSGMDAMKEIRDLDGDKYKLLSIIAMGNDAIEDNRDKLLEAGFTDSIVKPIDIRRVAAILKDCLPESKIKEKSNDITKYIKASKFGEGLYRMSSYISVDSAIEKIGGSIDVFNKLIVAYYNQNSMAVEDIYERAENDVRGFKSKIHSLRAASINIGAYEFANKASKMEAAINTNNKDYINNNLEVFTEYMLDLLIVIEDYISYIENVSRISDDTYAKINEVENSSVIEDEMADVYEFSDENLASIIDFAILEQVKYAALENDYDTVNNSMKILLDDEFTGENKEFIEVLIAAVNDRSAETIDELVTTYIDLKM